MLCFGLSFRSHWPFNLGSVKQLKMLCLVLTYGSHWPFRLSKTAEDVVFTIKGFSEDPSCLTLKAVSHVNL